MKLKLSFFLLLTLSAALARGDMLGSTRSFDASNGRYIPEVPLTVTVLLVGVDFRAGRPQPAVHRKTETADIPLTDR